jgi:hypothetical protein
VRILNLNQCSPFGGNVKSTCPSFSVAFSGAGRAEASFNKYSQSLNRHPLFSFFLYGIPHAIVL